MPKPYHWSIKTGDLKLSN